MKKLFFTLLSFGLLSINANAQYCGNSAPSVCNASGTLTEPGLSPKSDSLPVINNGDVVNQIIQFKNFDTITFGGNVLTVQWLKVDTIANLPAGLCWATDQADNQYDNQEDGCIKVTGTACDDPGQYRLFIKVTACVGASPLLCIPIQTDAAAAGLSYYVRLKNPADAEQPVDTAGEAAGTNSFKPYGGTCTVGINELAQNISSLNIVPNSFSNTAEVIFFSEKEMTMTAKITNLLGSEVYSKELDVRAGENRTTIERGSLSSGAYFYSLSDGKNLVTKRFFIIVSYCLVEHFNKELFP